MAYSITEYNTDGITTQFDCIFPVIAKEDIYVTINDTVINEISDYNIIDFYSFGDVPKIEILNTGVGDVIKIQRITNIQKLVTEFSNGSILFLKDDLNKINLQLLFSLQEIKDLTDNNINTITGNNIIGMDLNLNMNRIIKIGDAVDEYDGVNLKVLNQLIEETKNYILKSNNTQVGQTFLSSNENILNNDFIKVIDRSITNVLLAENYEYFNEITNNAYLNGSNLIITPITSPDYHQKYYTRIK